MRFYCLKFEEFERDTGFLFSIKNLKKRKWDYLSFYKFKIKNLFLFKYYEYNKENAVLLKIHSN